MGSLEGTFDTKLHEAVRYGDIEDVRVALHHGYDPNLIGLYQWSALHEAANNGELEILQLLLKNKGDPNKQDLLGGYTAVHYAAKEGNVQCLEELLQAGGMYSIRNSDGKTCLDVATGECYQILESLRVKDLMKMSPEEVKRQIQGEDSGVESPDLDQSISTDNEGSQAEDVKPPALGYIHLTFEYHSRKGTLKIRVWQISDLLLPPPSTSMISSIYVKSYLMPDKKRESKRKTEEVKIEKVAAHVQFTKSELSKGVQHVFSPSTFTFSKKLEYEGVNNTTVKEKSVQIEVCITQKYSKKSYLIGMFHLSLADAVKKIVREKYPLIPCMNHTIPANMKVYCASHLQITNSNKIFYSNPDVRNLSVSDISEISDRAASDPDLQGITMVTDVVTPRSVSLDINDEDLSPRTRDQHLDEIVIKAISKNSTEVSMPGEFVEGEISSDDESVKVKSQVINLSDIADDSLSEKRKSAFTSIKNAVKGLTHVESLSKDVKSKRDVEIDSPRGVEDWKYREVKKSSKCDTKRSEVTEVGSRPETPTWDYYDFDDMKIVEIPLDESTPKKDGIAPVCLPMETTLGLQHERSSMKKKKERKKSGGQEGKWPGKAIPVIVVTDADKDDKSSRTKSSLPKKSSMSKKKSTKSEEEVVLHFPEVVKSKGASMKSKNVAVDISDEKMSRTEDGKFKVIVDIHSQREKSPSPDVSIDVGDSDSFVIDLENLEDELDDQSDISESVSLNLDTATLAHSYSSSSSKLRSKLALTRPIPMQVFIDDSVYDSDDNSSRTGVILAGQGHRNDDIITEL